MNNPINLSQEKLNSIWAQVPTDYYDHLNLFQSLWHNHKIRVFEKILTPISAKKILEIGCANGHLTTHLARVFPRAEIVGIDVYKPVIKAAQKRNKNCHITFKTADAHALPFPKNTFDLVVCSETIEHVVNPPKILLEIKRVLKPRGYALIEMDSGNVLFRSVWFFYTRFMKGRVWQGAHLHPFPANKLKHVIQQSGLKIITSQRSHIGMAVTYFTQKKIRKRK